jgi:hypothetical protein
VISDSVLPVSNIRDLTVLGLDRERVLLIACDSVGSIGPKPQDRFPVSAVVVAHFAARVPLLEVMAAGGRPEVIIDTLSVEMNPTGAEMIAEIQRMADTIGLGPERITGSTEDNVPSVATGIGVTVIGSAARSELRPGTSQRGDLVLCLGAPTSAPHDAVVMDDQRMVSFQTLGEVLEILGVHDALPVGSRGIGYEVEQLAASSNLVFEIEDDPIEDARFDFAKTGGPASCVLLSLDVDSLDSVLSLLPDSLPRAVLGKLK